MIADLLVLIALPCAFWGVGLVAHLMRVRGEGPPVWFRCVVFGLALYGVRGLGWFWVWGASVHDPFGTPRLWSALVAALLFGAPLVWLALTFVQMSRSPVASRSVASAGESRR